LLALLLLLAIASGCDTSPTSGPPPRISQPRLDDVEQLGQDDLKLGLEFLNQVYEPSRYYPDPTKPAGPPEVDQLAVYHLNQWLAREGKQAKDWKPTPLLQYVPKSLAAIQPLQEIGRLKLTADDLQFLHGRIWQRDIAERVTATELPARWSDWLTENPDQLPEDQAGQLAAALRLFDWTIRNVQLDPIAKVEEAAIGTSTGASNESAALPPQRGIPGPGYQRYPYETLLYGHGDAYERARVFMELCRQKGIDTTLLAVASGNAPARPWAVAALIGEHLYLFDAELGLPIAGPGARGVATLGALANRPELLQQMNVGEKQAYWVKQEDLKSLQPWLSASPEELSKRMWLLDRNTSGDEHLSLYVDVDAVTARLLQSPQLKGAKVSLWRVPFEASLYVSLGLGLRLSRDQKFATQYENEVFFVRMPMSPIRQARQLQFRGTFDTSEDTRARRRQRARENVADPMPRDGGAVELYLMMRPEGRAIEDLAYSEFWQKFYNLNLPQDEQQRKQVLEMVTTRIKRSRDDVSYWLGLIQYEKGDYENAITWLKQSLSDEESDDQPWKIGARYNLARSYEALGKNEEAIKLYQSDDSPQKYGNRLRAKWLSRAPEGPAAEE
jgi:tetratricopeptide (TPR) repeat protein